MPVHRHPRCSAPKVGEPLLGSFLLHSWCITAGNARREYAGARLPANARPIGQNLTLPRGPAQPYNLVFQDVHYGHTFHQCVFFRIKPDPAVVASAAKARAAYGVDPGAPYMPHLSLLYADLESMQYVPRKHALNCTGPNSRGHSLNPVPNWERWRNAAKTF